MINGQFPVRQLHPLFAGELSGVDVGGSFDPTAIRGIAEAIDRYAVPVLPDQDLDDERQLAFARISARSKRRAAPVRLLP